MRMPQPTRSWTVEDVHSLPDDGKRYEVIDGELFVTPAPRWSHQRAVMSLSHLLFSYLERERVGIVLIAPADVDFSRTRLVQPDVFVVPLIHGRPPARFTDVGRLLLAAEVLSPSTARADRVSKRKLFRDEGVPEYWIVDADARAFERTTPGDTRTEVIGDELRWHPEGASSPFVLDVRQYFAKLLGE